ncbi:MAG: hypothetical protein ACI8P9_003231 [Parasphingorhabdus sp.]|jgi:hypothetical protein
MLTNCPACGNTNFSEVVKLTGLPERANQLFDSRFYAQRATCADMLLVLCNQCSLVYNRYFSEPVTPYGGDYENALDGSDVFCQWAESKANSLITNHRLNGKAIVEFACGNGYFLKLLCTGNNNTGIGYDPALIDNELSTHTNCTFIAEHYLGGDAEMAADLVVARHYIEHLSEPQQFLSNVRSILQANQHATAYLEVPDSFSILTNRQPWDFITEHITYYTSHSFRSLLEGSGLQVERISSEYGGQFLCAEVKTGKVRTISRKIREGASTKDKPLCFRQPGFAETISLWRDRLKQWKADGYKIGVWGAGSKGCIFSQLVGVSNLSLIVDINPKKQGHFLPASGLPIISPAEVVNLNMDILILANPQYRNEVIELLSKLNVTARLISMNESMEF